MLSAYSLGGRRLRASRSNLTKPGARCAFSSLLLSLLFCCCSAAFGQGFVELQGTGLTQFQWRPKWLDVDNDGDLDLFMSGYDTRPAARVFLNNGAGVFTELGQNLGIDGEGFWYDLDGDGDLDLLISGKYVAQEFGDYYYEGQTNAVYLNNGSGLMAWAGALPEPWIAAADINNDGKLEILVHPSTTIRHAFASLVVSNGQVTLLPIEAGPGPTIWGVSTWKDFDRDGDLDALYVEQYGSYPKTRLFRNDGAFTFAELSLDLAGAAPVPAWQDFDGDGFPDLFHRYYNWGNPTQTLYHNERDGRFTATSVVWPGLGESSASGLFAADYDNDGDWDALWPGSGDGTTYYVTTLYRNDSNLNFVKQMNPFPPLLWSSAAWGDVDNDGRVDLVLAGRDLATSTNLVKLYRNLGPGNSTPSTPAGLRAQQSGEALVFRWDPAADAETSPLLMTYELRIGTTPGGRDVVTPRSNPVTGFRRVAESGQILTNEWSLRELKPGTYYWTVQAIDTGLRGTAWAPEQSFVVTNTAPAIQVTREIRLGPSMSGSLPVTVSDAQSAATQLTLTAQSLDNTFIPSSSVNVQGSGAQRTVNLRVGPGQVGTNYLLLRATDPGGLFAETRVTVISEFFTMVPIPASTNFMNLAGLQIGWGYPFASPVVDLDRDGDLDVLLQGSYMSNNWQISAFIVASNGGSGNFTLNIVSNVSSVGTGYSTSLDDFDHDGTVDIVSGGNNYGAGTVQLIAGDGRGGFIPGRSLGPPYISMMADVDGDGDLDGLSIGPDLVWYENVGGLLRTRPGPPLATFTTSLEPTAARAVDLDHDGDIDFMVPGGGPDSELYVHTLLNSGRASFTRGTNAILSQASLYGTYSYDANDDGDMDVAFLYSTSYAGPIVPGFARNDGLGNFSFSNSNQVPSALAADFNNDGNLDRMVPEVISVSPYKQQFRLYLKTGPNEYAPQPFVLLGSGFAADFDGDGDLDYMAIVEEQDDSGHLISPMQLRFYRNNIDTTNRPPAVPGGLRATQQSDDRVTFAWNGAPDDHTPANFVTYNLRLGTTPGGIEIISPCSEPVSGRRWVSMEGNVGRNTFRDVRSLPPGTYYWSVQAVDGVFAGSGWAPEQTLTINHPTISTVPDVVTPSGVTSKPVTFTVTGGNSAVSALRVTVVADDPTLLPASGFAVSGTGTQRALTITPANRSGETDITITATDLSGFSAVTRSHVRVAWWDPRPLEQVGIQRFEEWHWADVDQDGRLDLFGYVPIGTGQPQLFSFRNLGNAVFQAMSNTLPVYSSAPVIVGGYAGDNAPDVLTLQAPDSNTALLQVWQGSGTGFQFGPFNPVSNRSAVARHKWIDVDNDGWADVVHFGWATPAPSDAPSSALLIARGKPNGGFEYLPQRYGISGWAMAAADFDSDGDLDLVVSGSDYQWGTNCNRVFLNQGNGNFLIAELGLPQNLTYRFSVVDVDRDGRPDLLLCPYSTSGTNRPALMRNTGSGFVEIPSNLPAELNFATWADYDNDGDPDLLLVTGTELPAMGDEPYRAALFRNDGGTLTRADTGLPSLVAHQADFADVDNDGDLDLLISGETGWNRTGRFLCLNTSPRANTPPPAPVNLTWSQIPDGTLLQWTPAADAESGTALTYNLRLGTTPGGSEIISAVADPATGQRRLADIGNIGHVPKWKLVLPDGTYYWSVQSIDSGLAASPFATEQVLVVSRPRLSAFANIVLRPSQPSPALPFTISGGTAPFQVSVVSSDASLVAPNGLVLGGSDRSRTLTIYPAQGRSGSMTVSLTVTDAGGGIATGSFEVKVLPAFTVLTQLSNPVAAGSLVWGDPDRDGDLDLWVSGWLSDYVGNRSTVFRNDRNGTLTASLAELTQLSHGEAAWGDFDRDGDLDGLISGYTYSSNPSTALSRNDLPTGFTTVSLTRLPSLGDSSLAWADADGDGDLDVLISGISSSGIRQAGIYLNNGSGSFSNNLVALPPVSQGAVAWADFDKDGRPDFVLTGSTNGTAPGAATVLYRNLGGGAFQALNATLPGLFHSAVAWADYDRDGDPDLLLAGLSASGPVTLLLRNDNGAFTPVPTVLPGVADGALAWGDVDGDGYPDLALSGRTANGSLVARIYWNLFGVLTDSGVELPAMHFSAMAWGDLDYDGRLDLAVSGSTNSGLNLYNGQTLAAVYGNNLSGIPQAPPVPVNLSATVSGSDLALAWNVPAGAPPGLSFDVRIGRTSGGSQVMSAFADPVSGVRRVAQAGQAGWSGTWNLQNLPPGTYYWSAQSVNSAYVGSAFAQEGQFSVYNTQPTITAIANQTMPMNSSLGPLSFMVSDAETDPNLLTVVAVSANPTIFPEGSIVIGGSGVFRDATFTPAANASGTATIIFTVRDPDGGMTNVSTRITVNSLVDAVAGFPDGQFSVMEPGDVDGDGDLDMLLAGTEYVSAGSGRSYVRLFYNNGNGTFSGVVPSLPAVFNGAFAAWADYDNDGDLDLFYSGAIYRQDFGTFTLVNNLIPGIQYGQAAWGDYDGDGDLDLAVSGGIGSTTFITRIYRNDGNDTFTLIDAPLQGLWYSTIAWGDVDGDGDLDLAISGAAAQNTSISANGRIYRNDGNDQFLEVASFLGAVSGNITWGDVTGDGLLDLAVTGSHGGSGIDNLLVNLGNWQFSSLALHPGASTWVDTRLLDWDGDGDLDLLAGINSIVGVYPNPGTGEFSTASMATTSIRCRILRWGDFDNDQDFDVLLNNSGTTSPSGQTRLFLSPRLNTQPAPPAELTQTVDGNSVSMRWPDLPAIDGAPVSYNLRVGTAPRRGDIFAPQSRAEDGRRLIPVPGGCGFAHSLTLRQLPPGTYYWSVQAVDHLWRGQPWLPEQKFTVTAPIVRRITEFEMLSSTQVRLAFEGQPGRPVALQISANLVTWTDWTTFTIPLSGRIETTVSVNGNQNFFRFFPR